MHQWFRKGNARRFHRVNMPLRHFIVPSSPLENRDIYATGADYFPESVTTEIETLRFATLNSLDKIQDQQELIKEIITDVISDIDFFGNCLKNISEGQHPKQDPSYWMQINQKLHGFDSIKKIKESSPKTFQYLSLIEDKYLSFLNRLVTSINDSSVDNFAVEGYLPFGFKLDETLSLLKQEKFAKIPLIQTIINLAAFLDAYQKIHIQINDDNYLRQFPQDWPLEEINISASGVAVMMPKMLKLYSKVDVHLYFENDNKAIHFEGSVVDIRKDEEKKAQRIAINFEFPNGNDQNFIQQEIQKQEVKECMKFAFY